MRGSTAGLHRTSLLMFGPSCSWPCSCPCPGCGGDGHMIACLHLGQYRVHTPTPGQRTPPLPPTTPACSYLDSEAFKHWRATGRMPWREFGTAVPHASLLASALDALRMLTGGMGLMQGATDNACVSVIPQVGGLCIGHRPAGHSAAAR